jgi:hypothetical protein
MVGGVKILRIVLVSPSRKRNKFEMLVFPLLFSYLCAELKKRATAVDPTEARHSNLIGVIAGTCVGVFVLLVIAIDAPSIVNDIKMLRRNLCSSSPA